MPIEQLDEERISTLDRLSALDTPVASSTVDGRLRTSETTLAARLEVVRGQVAALELDGSCPFTGWDS